MKEGYKKTKLGIIPNEWKVKSLGEFTVSNSYGPRFSAKLYNKNGNCRVIRGTDVIGNGKVNYSDIPLANIPVDVLEKHRLLKNDLVVVTTADCGMSFVFDSEGVFIPSAYMVRVRLNEEVDPYFVNKFFDTRIIKKQVESHVRKGTIANLPGSDLLKFKVYFPPLSEQKKIASILSSVDEHIDEVDGMIEDLKELKKGLMQKLLTEGIGNTEFKETKVGRIPKEWEVKLLKDVTWYQEGPGLRKWQFTNSGIKVINVRNLVNGYLELSNTVRYISVDEFESKYKHFLIDSNDIVIASSGNSWGKVSQVREKDLPLLMNTSVIRFKCENRLDRKYLLQFLQSTLFKAQIALLITGSAQPNFGPYHLDRTRIPVPTLEEQKQIASILSSVDERIEIYEKEREDFSEIKKGLMQQLLTGKVRVKI